MDHAPRDLRRLAAAVGLSALGDMLALIALVLAVHELTGSSVAVSALLATTLVPVVAMAPLAGLLVDRVESVRVLVGASLFQAVVAAALALTVGDLAALLALSALLAAGSAVSLPAEAALMPAIAGEQRLARANGTMESARYAGFAAGPVVAAALTGVAGPAAALAVNAASFVAIAAVAASLRTRRRPVAAGRDRGGPGHHDHDRASSGTMAGLRRLWDDGVLRVVVGAAVAALALVSITLIAEVFYAKEVLHAGDEVYALLTGAWMVGMVAGASAVAPRVPPRLVAAAALAGLVVQGIGIAGQVPLAVVPAALLGYCIGGVGHGAKNALIRTLLARRVPDHMHGRAFAAYGAARNCAELAAIGVGGALVAGVGPSVALLIAGTAPVLLGLAGLAVLGRPRLRPVLGRA
ncbi:MAG TPA: MFS transporter [Thermoleophilaceae bacterium]|nr:MFS transporter [Thermoleophilaceae bacterium]